MFRSRTAAFAALLVDDGDLDLSQLDVYPSEIGLTQTCPDASRT